MFMFFAIDTRMAGLTVCGIRRVGSAYHYPIDENLDARRGSMAVSACLRVIKVAILCGTASMAAVTFIAGSV